MLSALLEMLWIDRLTILTITSMKLLETPIAKTTQKFTTRPRPYIPDYHKAQRHGFAVMVHGRMLSYIADTPVLFGMTGVYGKDGMCRIRRCSCGF